MAEEFRQDGWPLCPRCGEDELACLAWPNTLAEVEEDARLPAAERRDRRIRVGLFCYRCTWKSAPA